ARRSSSSLSSGSATRSPRRSGCPATPPAPPPRSCSTRRASATDRWPEGRMGARDDAPFRLRDIALTAYGPTIVGATGYGAVTPVLALRARELGADVSTAALVVALVGIGMLCSSLPSGVVVDRI